MKFAEWLQDNWPGVALFMVILIIFLMAVVLVYDCVDGNYSYVIMRKPNGDIIEGYGQVNRHSNSYISITIDGVTYATSYNNVLLIKEK